MLFSAFALLLCKEIDHCTCHVVVIVIVYEKSFAKVHAPIRWLSAHGLFVRVAMDVVTRKQLVKQEEGIRSASCVHQDFFREGLKSLLTTFAVPSKLKGNGYRHRKLNHSVLSL